MTRPAKQRAGSRGDARPFRGYRGCLTAFAAGGARVYLLRERPAPRLKRRSLARPSCLADHWGWFSS
jgi:hypothetical protein